MLHLLTALLLVLLPQASQVIDVDPAIKAVVDRFFETQQSEDADAYLALWSSKAQRPTREQLKYIFDSGDDKFTDITITRAAMTGDTARVRVMTTRRRTDAQRKNADGTMRVFTIEMQVALTLVREDGVWKIVREGQPADELAAAILETEDAAARKALLESEPDLLNVRLVDAIARRADALARASQYKAAQAIYERGLEVAQAVGDRKAEGQALQNIANALYYQRDFPGALKRYEARLLIDREIANEEGIASALLGIGTIQYSTYDYSAALQSYRDALTIQEKLGDEAQIGTTLISTGNVLYLQGDFDGAIADYRRAEALKRKNYDEAGAASALEGLGRVYFAQGDYAAALGAFDGVLRQWRTFKVTARQALVLQSIGDTHFRLGNNDQARAAFDEARKDFESVKDIGNAGRVLQGAALNELVVGRFPVAEQAYTQSIALCTSVKDAECIARAQVGLAFALGAQQRFDDAITWYGRSLISFNDLNMEDAAARARIGLAEAFYGKGEFDKALEEAVNARRTGVALASDDLLWRALVSQAHAERKLSKPEAALGSARAALLAVHRMATAALDRPDQTVPRDTATAFATLAVLQAESGDAGSAFATAEQMRLHALRGWLAPSERDISRGMTAAEREEERKLAMDLMSLLVKRGRQKELPKPDAAIIEKLDASIEEMTSQRSAARQRLFARLPDLRTWRALDPPATADDLTLLLDTPDKVLLEFVVDEHDIVVFLASRGEPGDAPPQISAYVVPIERQALANRIVRALDGKVIADGGAWRKGSAELFHLLPSEVVDRLTSAKSIVVSPHDVLWRVPFEAMPVETRYLADRAVVTYAVSVGTAVRVPAPPAADPKAPVIVVASPRLSETMLETLKATSPTWVIRPADTADAEVARIVKGSSEAGPIVLSGVEATRERLTAERKAIGPLHVAAPFRVNSAGPLFSPILLADPAAERREPEAGSRKPAPESREPEAGQSVLETRDLFRMDPLASVVTFSDPAGLSKRDAAEAAGIVYWAWRSSGATTVIFRRWGGDDPAATEMVGLFYDALHAGKSPSDALNAARAAIRSTEAGRAPAAWAGWLIFAGR